ncbi:glycosyltransferase family 2 protein [Streptomyces sp. TLI_171]|uniref:glycosyltransferase family 2 protein n=1 Tax=Streptomyces sp. TLI_171 TaxID=1938859 RepID=UPI000C195A27|nr:glycosyltransferase [Streptomyces sp. TLI_171]RKE22616.1 glycosyl transferase family 2 [Streptomyces sp. TLI_171]
MNGSDRRHPAACPPPAAPHSPHTPVTVVELDLDDPGEVRSPGGRGPADPDGRVSALVRLHGHPLGMVHATGTSGRPAALARALVAAAHRELPVPARSSAVPAAGYSRTARDRAGADRPTVSVVVPTHHRPEALRRCLDTLLRSPYPHYEVLVVDNAPTDDRTRLLIDLHYRDRVRYLCEPVTGSARARNCGLAAARGELTAFADDDVLVDTGWIDALADAFADLPETGCVTGLVLPAELDTPAQRALELYGGYARGYHARTWSLADAEDPLLRFSVGRCGSGANMAFRTELLRRLGGFDPATGAGTPARGGEELLAFFRILGAGAAIAYQPDAIVWHRHPRTDGELADQVYNFGVGFGAYLTAAVTHHPATLAPLVRRLPRGLWQWQLAHRARTATARTATARACAAAAAAEPVLPAHLGRRELCGLLYGPLGYLISVRRQHTADRHAVAVAAAGGAR